MENLLDKGVIIFAGKGGVGKTTCSSATALAMAKAGRKTLLVTVDPAKRLEDALGVKVGFTDKAIQPNLSAMMLDPGSVIEEHLERELPDLDITEHPMFRYVTQYLPGLNELMAIGKLNDFRKEGKYEVIVIDTAPTGHALSFLSVPKAMKELMSEKSLLKWAVRGYTVWQKVTGAAKNVQNVFKKKADREAPPPDIDFERIFEGIQREAEEIQGFLNDPHTSSLVVVTLPEKLPVEETIDLYDAATKDLGMHIENIVVNKVQPDTLHGLHEEFDEARSRDAAAQANAAGISIELWRALLDAAQFNGVRRAMNQSYIDDLAKRLPHVALTQVPLFKQDVQGLDRLGQFREVLFQDA